MKRGLSKFLPEFVYGGMDGTVTTFAVVSGAVGASLSSSIILILGFANLFADGFSMAISNYLSNKSDRELNIKRKFKKKSIDSALATFISFILIGFIPLLFFVLSFFESSLLGHAFLFSSILTGITFFFIGFVKGIITENHRILSAFQTLLIGAIASIVSFGIGHFLRTLIS